MCSVYAPNRALISIQLTLDALSYVLLKNPSDHITARDGDSRTHRTLVDVRRNLPLKGHGRRGHDTIQLNSSGIEGSFDNVRLDPVAPEPGFTAVVGMMPVGFLAINRQLVCTR